MKKLIQTLKNIWSIDELKQKILITLLLVFVYRFGTHIVLPGIDPTQLDAVKGKTTGLLSLVDQFAGGAFSQASILALGIMPYISASIFMQLMTILVPKLQKIQKRNGFLRKFYSNLPKKFFNPASCKTHVLVAQLKYTNKLV